MTPTLSDNPPRWLRYSTSPLDSHPNNPLLDAREIPRSRSRSHDLPPSSIKNTNTNTDTSPTRRACCLSGTQKASFSRASRACGDGKGSRGEAREGDQRLWVYLHERASHGCLWRRDLLPCTGEVPYYGDTGLLLLSFRWSGWMDGWM